MLNFSRHLKKENEISGRIFFWRTYMPPGHCEDEDGPLSAPTQSATKDPVVSETLGIFQKFPSPASCSTVSPCPPRAPHRRVARARLPSNCIQARDCGRPPSRHRLFWAATVTPPATPIVRVNQTLRARPRVVPSHGPDCVKTGETFFCSVFV